MVTKEKIFEVAKQLLPLFIEQHKSSLGDKQGLALALKQRKSRDRIEDRVIGLLPEEKIAEKKEYASEKILRLMERIVYGKDEITSSESYDHSKKQFGGAIEARNYYISASNFPPHLDQKFVMMVALMVNELTFEHADKMWERSRPEREFIKKQAT